MSDVLVDAAYRGDLDLVKTFVGQGVPIDSVGRTYKHYPGYRKHLMIWVADYEARSRDVLRRDEAYRAENAALAVKTRAEADEAIAMTPFLAALRGIANVPTALREAYLLYFLDYGCSVNIADEIGMTPLIHAINLDLPAAFVRLLLERGADATARTLDGWDVWEYITGSGRRGREHYGALIREFERLRSA